MHRTRSPIDTRRYQTNQGQTNTNYRTQQLHYKRETDHLKLNNNINGNNHNARFLPNGRPITLPLGQTLRNHDNYK